jgi:plastocyanin
MRRIVAALILLLFISDAVAQTASISGTVTLPSVQSARGAARGNLYRNRLSPAASGTTEVAQTASAYDDVIVSAHPISFKAKFAPLSNARISQKNATFIPHVLPVTQGTTVEIVNDDPFYHNVFTLGQGERFNIGRRPTGDVQVKKVTSTGETKLFCDIHTQMNAIIYSLDTPYFTRAKSGGSYDLKGLPEGTYELRVYHPNFPIVKGRVELKAGQAIQQNFAFGESLQ